MRLSGGQGLLGCSAGSAKPSLQLRAPSCTTHNPCVQLVLRFTSPSITALIAWMALSEHLGWMGWLGCAASLGGVVLVVQPALLLRVAAFLLQLENQPLQQRLSSTGMVGTACGLSSAFFAALSYVGLRMLNK